MEMSWIWLNFSFKLVMSSFPICASFRCAMSLSTCPPMLIIHSININQEASSVEHISLFIRAVNKPSRREEKAPKGAYNKEELRQIETRGTANETMTLSHLWCWVLVWYRYTAGRHLCTLHWQPGFSLCIYWDLATRRLPLGGWTMWSSAATMVTPGTWTWTLSCGSWGSPWCLATDLEDFLV